MKYLSSRLLPYPACASQQLMIGTKREHALVIAPDCLLMARGLPIAHKATVGNAVGGGGRGSGGGVLCRRVCLSAAVERGCNDTQAFGDEHWSGAKSS